MEPRVQTERIISNNKPDSTIRDNKQGTWMSIDVAIPADRNVIKKGAKKILKYKNLSTEIQCTWNLKAKVIPIIIGRLEPSQNHSNSTWETYRENTKSNSHIVHCTQTAGSANVKVQNMFYGRNNITFSADCKYRTAATLYTVETWFVSGI